MHKIVSSTISNEESNYFKIINKANINTNHEIYQNIIEEYKLPYSELND